MRREPSDPLEVLRPGRLEYARALELQAALVRDVEASGGSRAFLLLLEHPPVYTLGRNADERHVRSRDRAIPLVRADRGGQATYHGPGQLVGWPVLTLRRWRFTVRRYVRALEAALLAVLAARGITGCRRDRTAGLWVGKRKIAAIGLRVARGIASHGFALNVANDLGPFARIDPCGEPGMPVTSVALETGAPADPDEVGDEFARRWRDDLVMRCDRAADAGGDSLTPASAGSPR